MSGPIAEVKSAGEDVLPCYWINLSNKISNNVLWQWHQEWVCMSSVRIGNILGVATFVFLNELLPSPYLTMSIKSRRHETPPHSSSHCRTAEWMTAGITIMCPITPLCGIHHLHQPVMSALIRLYLANRCRKSTAADFHVLGHVEPLCQCSWQQWIMSMGSDAGLLFFNCLPQSLSIKTMHQHQ